MNPIWWVFNSLLARSCESPDCASENKLIIATTGHAHNLPTLRSSFVATPVLPEQKSLKPDARVYINVLHDNERVCNNITKLCQKVVE